MKFKQLNRKTGNGTERKGDGEKEFKRRLKTFFVEN
jgi:hypothetical protein